jgi:hypothetical protein
MSIKFVIEIKGVGSLHLFRSLKHGNWSRWGESNSRPADYESAALPLSYTGVCIVFDNAYSSLLVNRISRSISLYLIKL